MSTAANIGIKISLDGAQQAEADIRRVTGSVNQMGMSSAQMANNLRMLPAQMTDIVTGLASGQAPLTVLLQQGGQLKDMFGGVGNATRALGGYVAGLVNPFTLAAAAGGALAIAYFKGAAEATEFNKQLILTGNAAGTTADQLSQMAAGISQNVGTQGQAADVLAKLVGTGRVAGDQLKGSAQAVVAMSKATGASVESMVADFASLGKEPAENLAKLNEKYNFLTAATYEQVVALEQQGRSEEAAALAQQTYTNMLSDRAKSVQDTLGILERSWNAVGDAAKSAWDWMADVGRPSTEDEKLKGLEDELASIRGFKKWANPISTLTGEEAPKSVRERDLEQAIINQRTKMLQMDAAARRQSAQQTVENEGAAAIDALKRQRLAFASNADRMQAELQKYRDNINAIRASNPKSELLDQKQIDADEANIREKYKERKTRNPADSAIKAAQSELEALQVKRQAAELDLQLMRERGVSTSQLNEGDKKALEIQQELKGTMDARTRSLKEQQLATAQALSGILKQRDALVEQVKAEREWLKEREKRYQDVQKQYEDEVKAADRSAASVLDRVTALKDEEAAVIVAREQNLSLFEAIESVRVARLEEAQATAKAAGNQEMVDALQREIDARRELGELNQRKSKRDEAADAFKDFMKADFGTDFAAGFDDASKSLGTFVQTFTKLIDAQEKYNLARSDTSKSAQQLAELDQKYARAQISSYASMAGAAKGFFSEKTAGYKALMLAEQTLRAIELASSVQRIAAKMAEGTAVAAVGVANQASGDPYSAVPRMAAMAGIMAALGFVVGGFGGGGSGGFAPTNTGTGTVLGDASAQSESITRAIDALREVDTLTMRYSAGMLGSLRNIEANIGGLATLLVRSGAIEGSAAGIQTGFKRDGLGNLANGMITGFGAYTKILDSVPLVGGILSGITGAIGNFVGNLFGSSTKITGQGIYGGAQSLGGILAGGFDAQYYTDVQTKKKAFGITTSKKNRTQYTAADAEFEQQIGTIFAGFYSAIQQAAVPLGANLDLVRQRLGSFVVDIGRIATQGLSGEQLQERLTAVFSAQGDRLAQAALGGFEKFQNIGEGYFETIVRVASGTEEARTTLRRLGITMVSLADITNKQGDVSAELVRQSALAVEGIGGVAEILKNLDGTGAEIGSTYRALTDVRMSLRLLGLEGSAVGYGLIDGAGGLQELQDAVASFEENFVSSNTQINMQAERLATSFDRLGLSLPSSADAFISLVSGIDTSTDAGQLLLGSVLSLSDGFGELLQSIKDVGSGIADEIARIRGLTTTGTQASLAELQANFAIKTAQARSGDQAAIDALPQISQALLKASETMAGTALDVAIARATTAASLQATLDLISDPTKRLGKIPGFATGGDFAGGLRIVGERGPELELTGASRIFNADQTARMLSNVSGGRAYTEMAAELKHLREVVAELRGLREDQRAGLATVARGTTKAAAILERVTPDGNSLAVTAGA
ncbi:MAG: phage tail length tape measure family protein [Aquabacterium sp.]|jgi:hypothetical protein|uniref:phage tail length tape measure family protein n=1 Tax=Aquabacterium sp. TaxID=1872578 RepID=UPI002A35F88E|nr:phage tail length tape measure family protein [Aquabacterium sp.]MDX9843921.1 phage tail length tape measure family protein [Aquabacterium sp.]